MDYHLHDLLGDLTHNRGIIAQEPMEIFSPCLVQKLLI